MRVAARLLLSLFVAAPVVTLAQQFRESVEVRLHNLDAVVTDKDGKPVTGLTKEDFIVLEDGVRQEITNFSSYENETMTVSLDGKTQVPIAPGPAPDKAPPARRFVFFIDDMAIQSSAREKLKTNARELVKAMRPGDVATVVRPTAAARIAQDYTGDMAQVEKSLIKAIDDCRIKLTSPAFRELTMFRRALETAKAPNEIAAAKRLYLDASRQRVEQRLGQIRALITSLSGADGKKILVLVTSGLSAQPGREAYDTAEQIGIFATPVEQTDVQAELEDLENGGMRDANDQRAVDAAFDRAIDHLKEDVRDEMKAGSADTWAGMEKIRAGNYLPLIDDLSRVAAAEGVTIYALEPEVPLALSAFRGADSSTQGSTLLQNDVSAKNVVPPEMLNQLLHYEGQTLTSMAEKTGGKWFRGIGAIDDTFRQVTSDLTAYYSIAYREKEGRSGNKPRRIQVSIRNRPELRVRTRTEVIDPVEQGDMSSRVLASLLYPRDINELKMSVTTNPPQKKGRSFAVPVEVVIPVDKITFLRGQDGKYQGRVAVHYATSKDEKEFVSYGRQDQIIELSEKQYRELQRIRYRYQSEITVPKGKIRIALGVTDATSKLSSLQTLSVEAK